MNFGFVKWILPDGFYLAGCGSVASALGSSLASSGGMGTAAGAATGAEVVAGTAVDVEPESCTEGLGASEAGGEVAAAAAAVGLAFQQVQETVWLDPCCVYTTFRISPHCLAQLGAWLTIFCVVVACSVAASWIQVYEPGALILNEVAAQ